MFTSPPEMQLLSSRFTDGDEADIQSVLLKVSLVIKFDGAQVKKLGTRYLQIIIIL